MNQTITIGEAGLILIGIAVFILLIYCILFVRNSIFSVKSLNKILSDFEVVSSASAKTTKEAEKIVTDLSESANLLTKSIKENTNIMAAIASVVNGFKSLKQLLEKIYS